MAPTAYRTLLQHEFERADARSIVTITRLMLADASVRRASDIHIDPTADATMVRLRIDGSLSDTYHMPASCHAELLSRLKILSRLRTDEHFSPQDGRFSFKNPDTGAGFDVRISIVPTQYGESAVLRLLIPLAGTESLGGLGLCEDQQTQVETVIRMEYGLILIIGPTGSGKTTTLYALIRKIQEMNRSIVSIEDPIEYSMPGVRQAQVQQGLTFADGLRALLRQDPDVIVIGEVRDAETASLAINAARTGHLVLSTIHSTDAEGAYYRLEELGIPRDRLSRLRLLMLSQTLVPNKDSAIGRHAEFSLHYA